MVLSKHAERTDKEQALVGQFYAAMNHARDSKNYYDFEAANNLHNLLCELSLPKPTLKRAVLVQYVQEYEWTRVSKRFRRQLQHFAKKLLKEI